MAAKKSPTGTKIEIPHQKWATWSVKDKVKAVDLWLKLGNLRRVHETTGVSYQLLKEWKLTNWWKDVEEEIKSSRRVTVTNKLNEIVDTALDVVQDRLINGDVIYNVKNGELIRKPVGVRDATNAASTVLQRQHQIEQKQKDEITQETTKTIQEQLTFLAGEFAKFNNKSKNNATDIKFKEIPNAIHEEREEGLQDRSEEVYLETGSSEEEGGAEQRSPSDGESRESAQG